MNFLFKLIVTCVIVYDKKYVTLGEFQGDTFTDCGGVYTAPKGLLYTPNFPGPYPTPIYCEWLIQAPPGQKIVVYFIQNYVKESIYITSYNYYEDANKFVNREELGPIFGYDSYNIPYVVGHQPFLLIQFSVEFIGNHSLRVIDHLLDVYGFNFTYEFADINSNLTKKFCSVRTCSFLGNCIASEDFSEYSCQCFDKFFGDQCQYGPFCDPENDVNLCLNGGRCKYFFGSLINHCECPDGFEGAYCEQPVAETITPISNGCEALRCSQQCVRDDTGPRCVCIEGYNIAEDNMTCKAIKRYRYDVSLDLEVNGEVPQTYDTEAIKQTIYDTLKANGIKTAADLEIKGIRNRSDSDVFEFHFYCYVSEANVVPDALDAILKLGQIAGLNFNQTSVPLFETNPELFLSEVMKFDPHPTLRGKMLTLVCAANGSNRRKFRWYKDNVRVDTSLTQRNAWETIVPHKMHGNYLSVLTIDSVMPIDQGVFTCQVEDFGKVMTGTVIVTVNNYPRVQLDPMSHSVERGQKITFKCLSPDDSWHRFTYEWYKNGMKILANSKEEYAETMYPTGVLLVVTEVKENTEYTCKVTNEAGPANVSAFVFVIRDNTSLEVCSQSYVGEVMWSNTSAGHFDVQRCPTEQGGYARRHCECDSSYRNCKWGEPNFSKCQSLQLIQTYDELELLRNGYQHTNLSTIFNDLYTFILLKNENAILFSGDMDMVAGILLKLIDHMKTYPQLVKRDKKKIEAKRLVDLIGAILSRSALATEDEKSSIMVGPSLVQTIHDLITGAIDELNFSPPLQVQSDEFGMNEEVLTEVPCSTCDMEEYLQSQSDEIEPFYLSVTTYIVRSDHLSDLLSYRHVVNNKDKTFKFVPISLVYSVGHIDDGTSFRNPVAQIIIQHNTNKQMPRSNTTVCLKWDFDSRDIHSGMWTKKGCVTAGSHDDYTVCECRLPGHFMAGMVPSNMTTVAETKPLKNTNITLLASYSISLIFALVALVIYLKIFSNLKIAVHTVHLSLIISIVLSTIARLACLLFVNASKSTSDFLGGLLTFSFYTALIALTLEMFHIFVITFNIKMIRMSSYTFAGICWGVPLVLLLPTVLVYKFLDHYQRHSCHAFCWMYIDTNQFSVFVLTLGFILSVYILLLILCICSLRKWTEEWRYAEKRTYVKSIIKNSILLTFLLLTVFSGIDLEPWSHSSHIACNITFQLSLCALVLIFRCIMNKHVRYLCVLGCCGQPRKPSNLENKGESKSFRAFMEPMSVGNVIISQEEDNVSKYYDEVNRTKYTKERKLLLSSLLGSATTNSVESGESTRETSVSYNSSEGSHESTIPVTFTDLFSHSGTDCGILMSEHSKSTSSVGASGSVKDDLPACFDIDDTIGIDEQEIDNSEKYPGTTDALLKPEDLNQKLKIDSVTLFNMPLTAIDTNANIHNSFKEVLDNDGNQTHTQSPNRRHKKFVNGDEVNVRISNKGNTKVEKDVPHKDNSDSNRENESTSFEANGTESQCESSNLLAT